MIIFCNIYFSLKLKAEVLNGLKCIDKSLLNILLLFRSKREQPEKCLVCGLYYPRPIPVC